MIHDNISNIRHNIVDICKRLSRDPDQIVIVGATKYANPEQLREVVLSGLLDVGENRVQDAKQKFTALDDLDVRVTKHMIGHLQTNKVKDAVALFDLIQSVDSSKLAEEIDKRASETNKVMDVLIEVNTSGEEQKFGIKKEEAVDLIKNISELKNIRILGLMTMAPFIQDQEVIRKCFSDLRAASEEIKDNFSDIENVEMKYLSMGMTDDYEIALEEGSNMVRIGRAIFE